jgi:hypothetical protein
VLRHQPVFTADVNRLLYSFIRVTAFTDHLKFAFVGALLRSFGAHPTWLAIHAQAARDLGVPEGLPVPPGAWSSLHDALGFPGVIEGSRLLYCLALASWQAGTFSQAAGAMEAAMRGEPPPVI